ncbi:ABC transporter substrate-binding protein [Nocardioides sp. SYSU DS0663]|uniref:ABC transporter substrate-binding protein n=1 Tax=Nocardioides sp. SYSU DS0663 TaxID=3416445 RepID=UPI003F4BE483
MRSRPLPAVPSALTTAALAAATALALGGCAGAPQAEARAAADDPAYPVQISSCGHTATVEAPPQRAVTLNQGATEVLLALGLEDRMAGTAYLDDAEPPQRWAEAYAEVPVLSAEYPTREELLAAAPDFVYASYPSAFDPAVAGSPAELERAGTAAYLSPLGCADEAQRPETSFESVWAEIEAVGAAFDVAEEAGALVAEQRATLDRIAEDDPGAGLSVLWYDSGDKAPLVGVGDGGPQLVVEAAGATNIFAGMDGGWEEVSWEQVVAADPDVIALADAGWSTAEEKIAYLEGDPVLSRLRAVREGRFVTVPYSQSTPGVTLVDGAASFAAQLADLSS